MKVLASRLVRMIRKLGVNLKKTFFILRAIDYTLEEVPFILLFIFMILPSY